MAQNMIEHHAAITVDAPIHQVYSLFSHFNDFPKFMSFVKEVTYYDDQRSHWVADVSGRHEWDAVNEDWLPDRQIGWRSVNGLNNYGRVLFQPVSTQQTHIDVSVNYRPPAGFLGNIGEHMGVGKHFDDVLQKDLSHFAEMVKQAPANALDPTSSSYLFHRESAAAQGQTTERQNATMGGEFATGAGAAGAAGYMGTTGGRETRTGQAMPQQNVSAPGSGVGGTAQGMAGRREDTPLNRPIMDRDIAREPGNVTPPMGGQASAQGSFEQPVLDRDIIGEQGHVAPLGSQQAGMMGNIDQPGQAGQMMPDVGTGQQAGAMGTPGVNPSVPPTPRGKDIPDLPPEQIPRWEGPEGGQPKP